MAHTHIANAHIVVLRQRKTMSRVDSECGHLRDSNVHVPALNTTMFAPQKRDSRMIPANTT